MKDDSGGPFEKLESMRWTLSKALVGSSVYWVIFEMLKMVREESSSWRSDEMRRPR